VVDKRKYIARVLPGVLLAVCVVRFASASVAQERFDMALALAIDVSASINEEEKILQRRGYIEAFRSREVLHAIKAGVHGAIVVTYFEWSGSDAPSIVVPWFEISNRKTANEFADRLGLTTRKRLDTTSISSAMTFAQKLLDAQRDFVGKRVLDISGDGPNNHGKRVDLVRDQLVSDGITINGLPIMVNSHDRTIGFDLKQLDLYYRDCVIGGPGSFLVAVDRWAEFSHAVRQKLVLEISNFHPRGVRPGSKRARRSDPLLRKVNMFTCENW